MKASVGLLAAAMALLTESGLSSAQSSRRPITVVVGASIAGARLGMSRVQIEALGFRLAPEGIDRAVGTGWISGPMLFILDPAGNTTLVSATLGRTGGVRINGQFVAANATVPQVARALTTCTLERGSGGRSLTCRNAAGATTHFYDSFSDRDVTVSLP